MKYTPMYKVWLKEMNLPRKKKKKLKKQLAKKHDLAEIGKDSMSKEYQEMIHETFKHMYACLGIPREIMESKF